MHSIPVHSKLGHLRKGRVSIPHARYFVTICTEQRKPGLTATSIGSELIEQLRSLHREGAIELYCATVMPDHIHLLYRLGQSLSVSQVQAKYKRFTRPILESVELSWQTNFYEHRLRADDSTELFARYVFLNPYRKRLITCDETWPWWVLSRQYKPEFIGSLRSGELPHPEWLMRELSLDELIERDV